MSPMLSALLALLGLQPASAEASRQALNRCSDAARTMRTAPSRRYEGKDVGPLEAKPAFEHLKQVVESWKRAQAQLQQVPAGELDWKDPRLEDCRKELGLWQSYIAELNGKIKGAAAGAQSLEPFLAEVKPYEHEFFVMAALHFEPGAQVFGGRGDDYPAKVKDAMEKVAGICEAKMPEAGANAPQMPDKAPGMQYERVARVAIPKPLAKSAEAWCWLAKNRAALLGQAAASRDVHVEGYGNVQFVLPRLIKEISAQRPGMDVWVASMLLNPQAYFDKLKAARAASDASLGATSDSGSPQIEGWLKELHAKVDQIAPQVKLPSSAARDSTLEAAGIKSLKRIYPQAEVVASQMDAPGWTIVKNELGIPLNRYRSGILAFKAPNWKWCQHRHFNWVETYSGGGAYEPPGAAGIVEGTRFAACP